MGAPIAVQPTERPSVLEVGRRYGRVPREVYCAYATACSLPVFLAYFVSTFAWQFLRVYTDFWLSDWTAFNGTAATAASTASGHGRFESEVTRPQPAHAHVVQLHPALLLSSIPIWSADAQVPLRVLAAVGGHHAALLGVQPDRPTGRRPSPAMAA